MLDQLHKVCKISIRLWENTKVLYTISRRQPFRITVIPQVKKQKKRQNVWSTIMIKLSGSIQSTVMEKEENVNCLTKNYSNLHKYPDWNRKKRQMV